MNLSLRSRRLTLIGATLLPLGFALACGNDSSQNPGASPAPTDSAPVGDPPPSAEAPDDSELGGELPPGGEVVPGATGVWFRDDFESGTSDNWDLTPGEGASFAVALEPGTENHVLQYTAGGSIDNLIALVSDAAWAATEAAAGVTPLADYYFEARIKPQQNSTTSNKQLFLVARYQDASNAYLGGLNLQTDLAATQVEAGARKAGTITRTVQGQRELLQGVQGQPDGQWYNVRFELIGQDLTVYLDGERIGSAADPDFTQGKIGLFTSNKSFLLDDVVVGDAAGKPVSLVLSPPTLLRTAEAATEPLRVELRALLGDGTTPDSFTVVSDAEAVASVAIEGTSVILTPLSAGIAHVTFTSGSQPNLSKVMTLTVTPPYQEPTGPVGELVGVAQPSPLQLDVPADTGLSLTFDAPPTLGAGSIRIFLASDDSTVDSIAVGAETDVLGPATGTSAGRLRTVNTNPVFIQGNTVVIKPHSRVLQYGTEYRVGIAEG
ncbi:MAG: pectin methylesterase, partial [Polyangiaceae bacterium]